MPKSATKIDEVYGLSYKINSIRASKGSYAEQYSKEHKDKSAYSIFGDIDEMKLKSSMTLFAFVSDEGSVFHRVLDAFYNGEQDTLTMDLLNK